MIDFAKVDKRPLRCITKENYIKILKENYTTITINKNILEAIDYLVDNYSGLMKFNFGKFKNYTYLETAILQTKYFRWYLKEVNSYPNNIHKKEAKEMFKILRKKK